MSVDYILVLVENLELSTQIAESLGAKGFAVEAMDGRDPELERALQDGHELAILDFMLNQVSGFEVLRFIRAKSRIPILLLTPDQGEIDGIIGLELGADDYLPQPFNPRELAACVRAILRRARPEAFSPLLPPADHRRRN